MHSAAIVARSRLDRLEYLVQNAGHVDWAVTEGDAFIYQNTRDATRAALALPSKFRAFALPVRTDSL